MSKTNPTADAIAALQRDLEAARQALPTTYYEDRPLSFRVEKMVDDWRRATVAAQELQEERDEAVARAERAEADYKVGIDDAKAIMDLLLTNDDFEAAASGVERAELWLDTYEIKARALGHEKKEKS